MNRFSRSWELIKASARVLAADKELLVFPIVSAIACDPVAMLVSPLIITQSPTT